MHTVILEYIWLDGHGELRSKYKTVYVADTDNFDLEEWNYDGSSTAQATTENSEIILKPVRKYKNPFFETSCMSYLVLCDTYIIEKGKRTPAKNNYRAAATHIFDQAEGMMPWF